MDMRRPCGAWQGASKHTEEDAPDADAVVAAEAGPEAGAAQLSTEAEAPDDAAEPRAQPPLFLGMRFSWSSCALARPSEPCHVRNR